MYMRHARLIRLALILSTFTTGAFAACSAGTPLLRFHLAVLSHDSVQPPLSVRDINVVRAGQKLIFAPASPSAGEHGQGKVSLIVVPANPGDRLTVLKPQPARTPAEWDVPFRTSVVALVYGPNGLDTSKVSSLVKQDQELIEQLADYAEQTAKTEQVLGALASWDQSPTATENLSAALMGFSSSYPRTRRFNWNASRDQQVASLIGALNPALSRYDPLAPEPRKRMQQSAMLASSVAGLFIGSPIGLAAGGAAMAVNLGGMIFPDTDFRSAFVQPGKADTMTLCAKRSPHRSRTRVAYLWASRLPNIDLPSIVIRANTHVPAGAASPVGIHLNSRGDWRRLDRARDWRLVSVADQSEIPVKVRPCTLSLWLPSAVSHRRPATQEEHHTPPA